MFTYAKRRLGGAAAKNVAPSSAAEPLDRAVLATLLLPIGAVGVAGLLFIGLGINQPQVAGLAAATPSTIRLVVEQLVKNDLTAERLKDAFGATQADSQIPCTVDSLPAIPPNPPQFAAPPKNPDEAATARLRQDFDTRRNREVAALDRARESRARRNACRALLASRLALLESSQVLVQLIVNAIAGPVLSQSVVSPPAAGRSIATPAMSGLNLPKDLNEQLVADWLTELQRDGFTRILVVGANARAEEVTQGRGPTPKRSNSGEKSGAGTSPTASAADPVDQAVARLISTERIETALQRGLSSDLRPALMGNGVPGWSRDVIGRLTWATMAFAFCAAFAFVIAASLGQLRHVEVETANRWRRNGLIAVALLGALVVAAPFLGTLRLTVAPLRTALLFSATRYGLGSRMVFAVSVLNLLAVVGTVFLIVGSVATFLVETGSADEVRTQLAGLRVLFNSGVIFLLAGTLEVDALLRWPAVFYPDPAAQALVATANWVATAFGAVFSVVLLAVYLPSVAILHEQVKALPADQQATAEGFFAATGFGDEGLQQLSRIVMALAPLLTGLTLTVGQTL